MTIEGVDYSESRPSPVGLANVGKAFVGRYVGAGFGSKLLDVQEADQLSKAGLLIVSLVEGAELDPLQGFDKGVEHAIAARNWHTAHGFPQPLCFYFAVDFDVQAAQWPAVVEYLKGAASAVGVGRVGIYGGINAMEWAARDGVAAYYFQTFAWSNGRWSGFNTLEQYRNDVSLVGGTVDLDRAMTDHYGGWSMDPTQDAAKTTDQMTKDIDWSVGRGAPTQPGHEPPGNEAITYWCGHITDRLVALQAAVDALQAAGNTEASELNWQPLLAAVQATQAAVEALAAAPAIDAVAVAKAIAASPDVVSALASAVAGQLGAIDGEVTLSGTMSAGVRRGSD